MKSRLTFNGEATVNHPNVLIELVGGLALLIGGATFDGGCAAHDLTGVSVSVGAVRGAV